MSNRLQLTVDTTTASTSDGRASEDSVQLVTFRVRDQLTDEECATLDEFISKLSFEARKMFTEHDYWRYLRARKWNVKDALTMIEGTVAWRLKYRPLHIDPYAIESEAQTGKMYVWNYTKQGMPVVYMKPGLDTTQDNDLKLKYLVYLMERAIEHLDVSRGHEKLVWLVDFEGFGSKMMSISHGRVAVAVLDVLQNHYPERLGRAIMFHAPFVFRFFWKFVSKFIDVKTRAKILILDSSVQEATKELSEFFEPSEYEDQFPGGANPHRYDHSQWLQQELENYKQRVDGVQSRNLYVAEEDVDRLRTPIASPAHPVSVQESMEVAIEKFEQQGSKEQAEALAQMIHSPSQELLNSSNPLLCDTSVSGSESNDELQRLPSQDTSPNRVESISPQPQPPPVTIPSAASTISVSSAAESEASAPSVKTERLHRRTSSAAAKSRQQFVAKVEKWDRVVYQDRFGNVFCPSRKIRK